MDFRLLGPFEATHGAQAVRLGRRQERLVLAVLGLATGDAVSTGRLTGLLWPDDPPANARSTLHTYIGRLRRALRPYGIGISHGGGSYRLDPVASTDVTTFRGLVAAAATATDPAERTLLCRRALLLWRGDLLADLLTAEQRRRLGAELSHLRLDTAERYAALLLDAGEHDRAVAELLPLARHHPDRERLTGLLMTALYRCDRRADALQLHDDARRSLRDLGVPASPELASLRDRVQAADPGLSRPPAPAYHVRVRDQWLPWNTSGHPALEFCNTYAGWGGEHTPGSEWLRSYRTLAVWAEYTALLEEPVVTGLLREAQRSPVAAADVLAEARELRARLYACLTGPPDGRAFAAVARAAEAAARVSVFVRGDDGLGRWRLPAAVGLRLPVHAVARSAAELLADPRRLTVRACPGPRCGWLFLDATARRRWCSLGTCGRADACRV